MAAGSQVKVGDAIPDVNLYEGAPDAAVNLKEVTSKGTHVFFGIPGAFTGTCTATHTPGFVENAAALREKGVENIFCVATNDVAVMNAFGKQLDSEGVLRYVSDPRRDFTKALGLEKDLVAVFGDVRMERWAGIVKDGVFTYVGIEPAGEVSVSGAEAVLAAL